MQVDFDRLWQYYLDGKLRHSVHESRDLHVWCYSQSTVYNRDWDDITTMCRGLVTDDEGNVCSRPFPKFYNWGEPEAPSDVSRPFVAYDKMDGSLILVGHDAHGDRVVSTKGSFSTWHSAKAAQLLGNWEPTPGSTAVFELIDPMNRIVVDYPESQHGLWLLGAVNNETGEDHYTPDDVADAMNWTGEVAVSRNFKLIHMLATVANPENGANREGFVLVYPNYENGPSERVKIKFAQYVNLHRILSRLNNVAVWEALSTGTLDALLEAVPDELYDKVRECATELSSEHEHVMMSVMDEVTEVSALHDNRRDQAEWVMANAVNPSLTFKGLDGKDLTAPVWAMIKPNLDREWAFLK